MIKANDPSLVSWVDVNKDSDFPIQNLPLGVFKNDQLNPRVGMRIGDFVIDMKSLHVLGYLDNLPFSAEAFDSNSLNLLMKKLQILHGTTILKKKLEHCVKRNF